MSDDRAASTDPAQDGSTGGDPTPSLSDTVSGLVATAPATIAPTTDARGTALGLGDTTFVGTQRRIAFMLLWIMIGVIAIITVMSLGYSLRCAFDGAACDTGSSALKLLNDSMSPIFTAMIGLVGSVVGFYFGSKQGAS